ncbi:MAG: NAD-dependent epimerase/dehydratase family protein [Nannocystaceae bacterium]|nr:NAD-dependent epimerase/dehydratase family protein [Nannocystaceae bacterium]
MQVFVTGATGFIGGRLARALVAAGHRVRALVRDPVAAQGLAQAGIELHAGDIRDRGSVREAMRGADRVVHTAAWYRIGSDDAAQAHDINVVGTRNVLEMMREHAVPRGVYTSSIAVYGDTQGRTVDEATPITGPWNSTYERTKALAHTEVALPMMAEGLPLVTLLPGVVYGPGDHSPIRDSLVQLLQKRLPVAPRNTTYCWAHVDDTAAVHVHALEHGRTGECYIVAGAVCELLRVYELAAAQAGVPAPRLHPSGKTLRTLARASDALARFVPQLPAAYRGESLRSVAETTSIASSAKAGRELGWRPRGLELGLRETVEHELGLLRR